MILTVTLNPAVDHTLSFEEPLDPGTVQRTGEVRFDAGGKGINVSKYLDGLGVETTATGVLGGFLGSFVAERLTADGITHDFAEVDDMTRLNTTVLADAEYKLNHAGPTVDASAIDAIVERIERYDPETVVVAGSLPPGLEPESVDRIACAGPWETVVDLGGEVLSELDEEYALCKPNHVELAAATRMDTDTIEECRAAAATFRKSGFERVVASLGADGALLATGTETYHAPALDTEVVDTVGAGDSLLSGVLAASSRGAADERALATGIAIASRVVAVPGTTVPPLDDIEADIETVSVSVV